MWRIAALGPMVVFISLIACARQDPVDENAIAPPDEMVGDASATGLAAPANAAAAEAAEQAALPEAGGGLTWSYQAADRTAQFGPPGTPAFSIQCNRPREGEPQMLFVRHFPPNADGSATLSFTGNGKAASVPIAAVVNPDGLGGEWRSVVSINDSVRDIAEAFAGSGPVTISIAGLAPIIAPAAPEPRRVFDECLSG